MTSAVRPMCPMCGDVGEASREPGLYCCPAGHRFWAATRHCRCGAIPTCPDEEPRVWVCVGCEQWEVAR